MGTDSSRADTRMMGIVHGALCRDLDRARTVLTAEPYPEHPRARALGEHVVWLMEVLHAHHTGEDEGLWPLVRERTRRRCRSWTRWTPTTAGSSRRPRR
ncbi:hypothetical protein E4K10_35440 [Streptomyces sp. T1317-0309]|nr:hypothetical protein E4K10_35440 [Streptomyces sp. T1317-0309]